MDIIRTREQRKESTPCNERDVLTKTMIYILNIVEREERLKDGRKAGKKRGKGQGKDKDVHNGWKRRGNDGNLPVSTKQNDKGDTITGKSAEFILRQPRCRKWNAILQRGWR